MRCKYRTGQIVPLWGTPAEYDYLLLCDGSQISAELYPELVKVLGGNTLPDLVGRFLEGAGSAGEYKEAGLPNINGSLYADPQPANQDTLNIESFGETYPTVVTGPFDVVWRYQSGIPEPNTPAYASMMCGFHFNAAKCSAIYGSSTTVQPKSMTVKYYICYAG